MCIKKTFNKVFSWYTCPCLRVLSSVHFQMQTLYLFSLLCSYHWTAKFLCSSFIFGVCSRIIQMILV